MKKWGSMFNEEQERALKQLENAFKRCKKVGLWLVGCNTELLVATHKFDMKNDSNKTYAYFESKHVNTHGCYLDSGAD